MWIILNIGQFNLRLQNYFLILIYQNTSCDLWDLVNLINFDKKTLGNELTTRYLVS